MYCSLLTLQQQKLQNSLISFQLKINNTWKRGCRKLRIGSTFQLQAKFASQFFINAINHIILKSNEY